MKTHNKIIALQISVILIIISYLLGYQNVRQQEVKLYLLSKYASDQNIINKVLEFKTESFIKPTLDNAAWDGMLEFTQNKDTAWAKENFDGVAITCDMSFLGAFDTTGKVIYSVSDKDCSEFSLNSNIVMSLFENHKTIHTFIVFKGDLFEIFGAKIVHSYDIYYKTPAHGYLISAKQWNKDFTAQIELATGFSLKIDTKSKDSINHPSNVIPHPVKNHNGQIITMLDFKKKSEFRDESKFLDSITIIGFIVLLVSFTLFLYLSNLWIAKPIKSLTSSLEDGEINQIEDLLKSNSGFGDIARLIKQFYEQKNDLLNEITIRTDAEEKLRALFEAVPDHKFIIDKYGIVYDYNLYNNDAIITDNKQVAVSNLFDTLPKSVVNKIKTSIDIILNGTDVQPLEYYLNNNDVEHTYEARFIPLAGEKILFLVRDITDRKIAENELILAKEKAQESDRLKTAFLANMSHEIRTPMNAILGFSKLLEEDLTKEEQQEYIDIIRLKGNDLMSIIDDVIDISKISCGQLAPVNSWFNFNYLIEELYKFYEHEKVLKEKNSITFKTSTPLPSDLSILNTDYIRLKQVFTNLIGNALKFTTTGEISFGYEYHTSYLSFFVSDTGKGIAQDKISIIFERFRQEEENYTRKFGGTGLGLTISKGLVELLGGEIFVESEEGKGSKFIFTIPYQQINASDIMTDFQ
ncbi:MAG: ATP-binding protein [bacterium]